MDIYESFIRLSITEIWSYPDENLVIIAGAIFQYHRKLNTPGEAHGSNNVRLSSSYSQVYITYLVLYQVENPVLCLAPSTKSKVDISIIIWIIKTPEL
jgi:hypothetical protein